MFLSTITGTTKLEDIEAGAAHSAPLNGLLSELESSMLCVWAPCRLIPGANLGRGCFILSGLCSCCQMQMEGLLCRNRESSGKRSCKITFFIYVESPCLTCIGYCRSGLSSLSFIEHVA